MRKFFFLPLIVFSLVSCSKKDTPEPIDYSAIVAGTYQVTSFEADGTTYILSDWGMSAGIKLSKLTLTESSLKITSNANGKVSTQEMQVTLKGRDLSSDIDIYTNGEKIGSVNNGSLILTLISDDGFKRKFRASK